MKIATWNVNGIRARQAQLQEWIEREQPGRRLPAGNQGDRSTSCRSGSARSKATGATGTEERATPASRCTSARRSPRSGRRSSIRRSTTRTASCWCALPAGDGRVGLRAERRQGLPGEDAVPRGARAVRRGRCEREPAPLVICGDLNIARTDMDVHPKERKPRAIGQLPRSARCSSGSSATGSSTSAARSSPTTIRCSRGGRRGGTCGSATSAGASTTCSPASRSSTRVGQLRRPARVRHERPRAGCGGIRRVETLSLRTQ